MKNLFVATIIFSGTLSSYKATAQNFENAGEYMQYISTQQINVTKKFLSYNSAASHGKRAKKVEKLREQLLNEVQESKMNISSMPKFKGDGAYKDSSASFMKFYYNVLNDDYTKIVNMEEIAEQSYDEMEILLMFQEQVDKKMEEANQRMHEAEKLFALQNNIKLVESENEMSEKMKAVSGVNEHYHKVYLTFFKPYLQEKNLKMAMEKGNVGGLEQDKNALLKYAQEALVKLETIKPYEGDHALKGACKQLMQFYVKEATDFIKPITDFLLVKERFETIKKDYEKKSDHSQQDVDAYNKAVNDINTASDKYNQANKNMFELGKENIENWNKAVNAYFDEHMPR
ncbi:MAG: hypothetical protein V4685_04250 [Bacteroidota bacterium]